MIAEGTNICGLAWRLSAVLAVVLLALHALRAREPQATLHACGRGVPAPEPPAAAEYEVLTFPAEPPHNCPENMELNFLHLRTRGPGAERYVSNFEVVPGSFLLAVRNLTRHWRTPASPPDLMEYWYFDAMRCGPRDDTVYDTWKHPAKEEAALVDGDVDGAAPPPSRVYLVLQQTEDESLGHMMFDVGIFFRYWRPLVARYPRLQLLLRKGSMYTVKRMLLKAYGIPEHRVVWRDFFPENMYVSATGNVPATGFGENNLVFFPPNVLPTGGSVIETHAAFDEFSAKLVADAGLPPRDSCASNPQGVLLIPKAPRRGVTPNLLETFPESVHAAVLGYGGRVVNTSVFSSIAEQAAVVGSARVIIVPVGSGLDWNALFMRGATIIATNHDGNSFHEYPAINDVITRMLTYNRLFLTNTVEEILSLLDRAMAAPPLPCPLKVTWLRRHYPKPTAGPNGEVIMPPLSAYADQDP